MDGRTDLAYQSRPCQSIDWRSAMMIYCPYSDSELDPAECSSEHIVPLSLGGMNGVEIPVSRAFNSTLGSRLDGAMANDFLTLMKRNQHDSRGHSGKRPVFVARRASDAVSGEPLQLHLDRLEGVKAWRPIKKEFVPEGMTGQVSFKFSLDMDIELRFVAKVALGAGYFVYGDLFRSRVKHDGLRLLMNFSPADLGEEDLRKINVLVDSRWTEPRSDKIAVLRQICKAVSPASVVGLVPSNGSLATFVGILGEYIGMVNAPADTSQFPNDGQLDWGHVIVFDRSSRLQRTSFRECILPFVSCA